MRGQELGLWALIHRLVIVNKPHEGSGVDNVRDLVVLVLVNKPHEGSGADRGERPGRHRPE